MRCRSPSSSSPAGPARTLPARRRDRGFSLIEVLIALAVLGAGLAVILGGLSAGLRVRRETTGSLRLARAVDDRLEELLAAALEGGVPPGVTEGEEGPFRWRVAAEAAPPPRDGNVWPLLEVRLVVEGPGGRRREIVTLLPEKEESP